MVRIEEAARAGHDVDLAHLGHAGEPGRQFSDHLLLVGAQLGEIDLGRAEGDTMRGHGLGFVHDGGGVEQCLRGDAADIEANPAQDVPAFHEHGLEAEIGGAEGCGIAAGTSAENEHFASDVGTARM